MAASPAHLERSEAQFRDTWGPAADAMRERGVVVGLPDQARERVAAYAAAGAARVNIAIRPPVDWEALEAWAKEVIPALADA
jgi:alkanesulfonate monooxygenase SsuD/methylene tetrahydromethanopterin reductase-like flavin-dependent oxidoreductase (luciferase family)